MDGKAIKLPSYVSVLKLVWPLALGMANNAAMQFADRVFLAHESAASLEAVLPASMLAAIFISFFQSIVAYAGTFVAQFYGARDEDGCCRAFWAGLVLAAVSALFFVCLIPLGDFVFSNVGHTAAVAERERIYYRILMCGAFATCGMMAASGYLTGRGRTRFVFWVNVIGNVLNVALDPILIFGWGCIPAYGIAGAATATVIAQIVQMLVLNFVVIREVGFRFPLRSVLSQVVQILKYGTPAGVYQTLNILSFTVFVFATAAAGDAALAVSNAVFAVNYLLFAPMEGFAIGAGILVGQFQGASDPDNAQRAGNRVLIISLIYIVFVSILVILLRFPILSLFAADTIALDNAQFMELGVLLLFISVAWQIFDAVDTVLSGALKGAGDTRFVMRWMLFSAFVIWLPTVFFVKCFYPEMAMFWLTMVLYVIVICIGTVIRWHRGSWRKIVLVSSTDTQII